MIYLGADHRGFKLKEEIKKFLEKLGYPFKDLGNREFNLNDDYPDFAEKVVKRVSQNPKNRGILFCGSGIGMSIAANKFMGIKAALCFNEKVAKLSRQHLNSNILCLPADFISQKEGRKIIKAWLSTKFSKEKRHQRRLKKFREVIMRIKQILNKLNFKKMAGLIPVIAQDFKTGKVLMLALMNKAALNKTLKEGKVTYFSRTRKKLWTKGETSGNFQLVKEIWLDCDNDTLLIKVKQIGNVCHTGHKTCFYRKLKT